MTVGGTGGTRPLPFAALVFSLLSLAAPDASPLRVRFIGNAAFSITDGATTLYSDFPYRSGAFGYMTYDAAEIDRVGDALCLITHGHADHFDATLFRRTGASVIAPPSVTADLPKERVLPFAPAMSWRGIRIEAFRTPHGDIEHDSYLVTWHGRRLYFTGDTDSTERLLAMRGLDVAFVTPWLLNAVARCGTRIDARLVVVHHHRAGEAVTRWQDRRVPLPGETIVLDGPAPSESHRRPAGGRGSNPGALD